MNARTKRQVVVLAVVAACAAVAARIAYVNANAYTIPEQTYSVGDAVPLEGSFTDYSSENTQGYSIVITGAQRMSENEYLDAYAQDEQLAEALRSNTDDATNMDAKTLIVLDITMINEKTAEDPRGYLDSLGWSLKDESRPEYWIRVKSDLLDCSLPQLGGDFRLSIKPGTQYQIHVPFASTTLMSGFPAPVNQRFVPQMPGGSYRFVVTKDPVRKQVDFQVQ